MTGPSKWSLGDEAPEPQLAKAPEKDAEVPERPSQTHTGTDPYGRAVGPLEDHTKPKKVLNEKGEEVLPKEARTKSAKKTAAKK